MNQTPFGTILAQVVEDVPGAQGAMFIDWEGEMVDAYSNLDEEQTRLLGAHWAIIYYQAKSALTKMGEQPPEVLTLRFQHQQVLIRRVTDEYLAIVTMDVDAHLGRALHLLQRAGGLLRQEM